ncbi:MAG: flagellar export protein FliJ [Burkholderiales bacterium]|nr:flagellar export protein FliJ [Burkholderiales bacterium]
MPRHAAPLPDLPAALRPLQAVLEIAERERDRARDALLRAEAAEDAARHQDELLARYARELDQRWGARAGAAGSPAQLQHAHDFGRRIDDARAQQRAQRVQLGERVERARAQWRSCEQRLAALRKLVERRLLALAADESRRAQRLSDESALRMLRAARDARAADTVF